MRTQEGNKRVVSKAHYAGIMGGRLIGYTASGLFFVIGVIGMILTGIAAISFCLACIGGNGIVGLLPFALIITLVFFLFSAAFAIVGQAGFKSLGQEETVVPLTRQTALDIPAEESLVRASSADTLASETVLLRPVQRENETASEELLRPLS